MARRPATEATDTPDPEVPDPEATDTPDPEVGGLPTDPRIGVVIDGGAAAGTESIQFPDGALYTVVDGVITELVEIAPQGD